MIAFAKRNLKLYLRDKGVVFFSLLGILIEIGLYVFFLGDIWTSTISEYEHAREMMDNWVIAGIVVSTGITTTMGVLGNMVRDRVLNVDKDFYVAPIKQSKITCGYMLSSYVIAVGMTLIAFLLGEIYIVSNGGAWLGYSGMIKVIGIILLTAFMNTALMLALASICKSLGAYSNASGIVGTLIGFLTGVYLPIGSYPETVQSVIKLFPVSHAALLLKDVMMEKPMALAFEGAPAEAVMDIKTWLGIVYEVGDEVVPIKWSILFIVVTSIVFMAIGCKNMGRKSH